jgi:hypothetical protein
MPESEKPKQTTEKGLEIPVPSREEFERNMDKIAAPAKPKPDAPDKR